jgi:hypothetical protein
MVAYFSSARWGWTSRESHGWKSVHAILGPDPVREPEQRPTFHQEGRERGPALVLALGTTLSPVELDEYQPLAAAPAAPMITARRLILLPPPRAPGSLSRESAGPGHLTGLFPQPPGRQAARRAGKGCNSGAAPARPPAAAAAHAAGSRPTSRWPRQYPAPARPSSPATTAWRGRPCSPGCTAPIVPARTRAGRPPSELTRTTPRSGPAGCGRHRA